ncbi:hypothetical protein [Aliarcobacter butzleri]|uniref:hypothetical protein n=1 Tax=Aliarcobacter butzleri TaxID=28197 RepID=UPI0034500410
MHQQTNNLQNSKFDNSVAVNNNNALINKQINNFFINFKLNLLFKEYISKDLTYWQWMFLFNFRSMFYILLIANIVLFFYFISPKDLNSTMYGVFASFGLSLSLILFLITASLFWNKWYYSKRNTKERKRKSLLKKYKSFK